MVRAGFLTPGNDASFSKLSTSISTSLTSRCKRRTSESTRGRCTSGKKIEHLIYNMFLCGLSNRVNSWLCRKCARTQRQFVPKPFWKAAHPLVSVSRLQVHIMRLRLHLICACCHDMASVVYLQCFMAGWSVVSAARGNRW